MNIYIGVLGTNVATTSWLHWPHVTRAGLPWLLTHLFLIAEPKQNKLLRFMPYGGSILFGIFSTSSACHSSVKTSINWILSTLKGSMMSCIFEIWIICLHSQIYKKMNKFDRVSAKLQIYFQTRVFYIFEQNNSTWKKYMAALPGLAPLILLHQTKA